MISYKREVKKIYPEAYCKLGEVGPDKYGMTHYVWKIYLAPGEECYMWSFTVWTAWRFALEDIQKGRTE